MPLTLIAAPAGFGKTTLLSDWIACTAPHIAWLSLDPGDDDPARFWAYVIAALETLEPGIGESALTFLGSDETNSLDHCLTALINAVSALPWDFGLVLDDYHVIENPQVQAAVMFLVNHLPEQMHVVIATRTDPPLPLASWRGRGQLFEIRATDLRFTTDESAGFLKTVMGLDLAPDDVALLESCTEGWIAGLQLAALAVIGQDPASVPGFIASSAANNRFVVDYLAQEVLGRLDDGTQEFLRRTSILNRFNAQLCNALTGREDSQAVLDSLERANLFIIPLDLTREWYRYHHLFAEVLRKALQQQEPDMVSQLHRRAGLWYEEHGLLPEAVGHMLWARDYERAANLIERSAYDLFSRGEFATVREWLVALPRDVLRSNANLCILYAAQSIIVGQIDGAEGLLEDAERSLPAGLQGADRMERLGLIATSRAFLALRLADIPRALEQTRQALAYLPDGRVFQRDISSWLRGISRIFSSESFEASQSLAEIIAASQASGDTSVWVLSTCALGFLKMGQGHLGQAGELYRRALKSIETIGGLDSPLSVLAYVGMSDLLLQQNRLDAAEQYLGIGMRFVRQSGNAEALIVGCITMAWLKLARGEAKAACDILDEVEQSTQGRLSPLFADVLQTYQAWLAIAAGRLSLAERWDSRLVTQMPQDSMGMPWLFVRPFELLTSARLQIARQRYMEALTIVRSALALVEDGEWLGFRISARLLMAIVMQATGETAQALDALEQALAMAEPEGHVRIFVQEGPAIGRLLAEGLLDSTWLEPHLRVYGDQLLTAFAVPGCQRDIEKPALAAESALAAGPSPAQLAEPLSPRELEILGMLATSMSNQEIAKCLYVSVATVKTHIHHIYGKLDVQGRRQALERARELDLL